MKLYDLLIDKNFAKLCRKMLLAIFIAYDVCLMAAPLKSGNDFLGGMQDIFHAYVFFKYNYINDITDSYAVGVLIGNVLIGLMLLLILHQILCALNHCMVNLQRNRSEKKLLHDFILKIKRRSEMEEIRITDKFVDFLIEVVKALALPTEDKTEHEYIESIFMYFADLKTIPPRRDRSFKKEVQDLWDALGKCAENSGHEETSLTFWNLQANLKKLKLERGFYSIPDEIIPEDEVTITRNIPRLKSFNQQSEFM